MPRKVDVFVVGLGAMGSATAWHLARNGATVVGCDRFHPPHDLGSSHGRSRIIREAYFEDPCYVPLVQRAFENWEELERLSGERIAVRTGGLMLGPEDGAVVAGSLESARRYGIPHELLDARDIQKRFPDLRPEPTTVGVLEPRAGYLLPERAIAAQLDQAARAGAVFQFDEPVVRWTADPNGVTVTTTKGDYRADRLVIAAGAWAPDLLAGSHLPLTIERQVVAWFRPKAPLTLPIFIWEYTLGHAWYGFNDHGDGVKAGLHHDGETTTAATLNREVTPRDTQRIRDLLARLIPAANGEMLDATVCMYTNTPDTHFLIDDHPDHPNVMIVSACSGHGFKFASAIGEVVADRIRGAAERFDLSPFRRRWTSPGT